MKNNVALLQRYWQEWGTKLNSVVRQGNAKLHFPDTLSSLPAKSGIIVVRPPDPICIFDAPPKASSRRGAARRLAIFINGSFELIEGEKENCLKHATCSVTFFSKEEDSREELKLKMVDALHFDIERIDSPTPFHPIFHAQRGIGIDGQQCVKVLTSITHKAPDRITVNIEDESGALKNPYFRIPTPQLDIFSVVTIVVADYFCNGGDIARGGNVIERFKGVLDLLVHAKNLTKEGHSAKHLRERWASAGHISTALWYPEHSLINKC